MRGSSDRSYDTLRSYSDFDPHSQQYSSNPIHHEGYLAVRRRRGAAFLTVILVTATLLTTFLLSAHHQHQFARHELHPHRSLCSESAAVIQIICKHTPYPDVCERQLSGHKVSLTSTPLQILLAAVQVTTERVAEAGSLATNCSVEHGISKLEGQCADDCVELLNAVNGLLKEVAARVSSLSALSCLASLQSALTDVKVWLSSALSYQTACSDNFDQLGPGSIRSQIQGNQGYLGEVIGVTLGLVDILAQVGNNITSWRGSLPPTPPFIHGPHRRLLSTPATFEMEDGFPYWVSAGARRLLQASSSSIAASANVVVAKDGSGQFTNITAALNAIPASYSGRYVLYIKQGVYDEVFNVTSDQKNITFVGDGIDVTIITGDRNVASGDYNTYRTSTVGVSGSGFYARDITFRNTAGPSGHQAVAMRAGADFMVFYHCSFEGYQDTLYALSSRQFYRECTISGTVDFIFGNAIAVFQNCVLVARLPLQGQQNTYTAQGRKLESDVSGYSFQNCTLTGEEALQNTSVGTYLGRPWKAYSRVVFMESELQGLIDPQGWLPWNASNPFTDTLYYGEYGNRGGGADTSRRVNWTGVHPNMSASEASQFTVANFIAGQSWLNPNLVTYQDSL